MRDCDCRRARRQLEEEQPYLVIGSPPHTYSIIIMNSNRGRMDPEAFKRRMAEACVPLDFVLEIYAAQLRAALQFPS